MRCLQCGKRLPLFRKVDGDFCSAAHAAQYAAREQSVAIARLKQATQHETKTQSLWERRRKLKNGDIPPAEMRGLVSLSLPNPVSHRTFQRVVANPRLAAMPPLLPAVDRLLAARLPWTQDLISTLLDLVDVESAIAAETPASLIAEPRPRLATAVLRIQTTRPGATARTAVAPPVIEKSAAESVELAAAVAPVPEPEPEPVAQPAETAAEPLVEMVEARFRQLAIAVPEPRRIAVRIRRPYAQSTPLRSGRRPVVFARFHAQPVEYQCSDPVREPAGLLALELGPRKAPPVAVSRVADSVLPAPARSVREFGHPVRLSALALLHTAVGLAALDGTLKANPGVLHPAVPVPEAAPVRSPGKMPSPAFPGGVRTPASVRGLGRTVLLPVAVPSGARPSPGLATGILAPEPFAPMAAVPAGLHPPAERTVRFTVSERMESLPPSQHPRLRDIGPCKLFPPPAQPVERALPAPSRGGCVPPPPAAGQGMGMGSRLAGIDAPNPSEPRHAVVRRPDPVPFAGSVMPGPPSGSGQTIVTSAAGSVDASEPVPGPVIAQTAVPAQADSVEGLTIVTAAAADAEPAVPPLAGPVPMVFEVRIAGGEYSLESAAPGLLGADLDTTLPRYLGAPVKVAVAAPAQPRADVRQQARASAKAKSAFAEPPPKPEPAFGKAGKPAAKRYVPVMAPTRPTGRPTAEAGGDPPMAQSFGLYSIVPPVRGSLAPQCVDMAPAWRKRRQMAGIRYQPAIDKLAWIGTGKGQRLKPSGALAEKNGRARFNLIDEIGVPGGLWHSVQRRWERTPAAAKWALPALLVVGFVVALPSRRGAAPANGGDPDLTPPVATRPQVGAATKKTATKPTPPGAVGGSVATTPRAEAGLRARIRSRAAVVLVDDFRAGLGEWTGEGNWARGWAYDLAGFVRPGAIGIYSPTTEMTDYQMELLGQIDRRSIGWVVRAADVRNYYAVKLVVAEAGPVPKVVLERYPVVRGVAGAVQRKSLHFTVRNDTSYRILTEVHGTGYAVAVQGNLVDSWTETRLERGGVGLFSSGGDQARVRWISVTHQDDLLGKLCAFFAPPSLGRDRGANE